MISKKLLVATRGEIAIRIMRAASELGVATTAIFSDDDSLSLHTRKADEAVQLAGVGPDAYLDIEQILTLAKAAGCDAIHPGCGLLAESAEFARRCVAGGLTFVGPRAEILELFGDQQQAQALATRCGVPTLSDGAVPRRARRMEVQIAGDGADVVHLWERETTFQFHHETIVAIAPSPNLDDATRTRLINAALLIAREVKYDCLGSFEFLVIEDDNEGTQLRVCRRQARGHD